MKILKKIWPIILVLALSYWSVKPLFHPGFFPMHDDTQIVRVQQMHKSLSDGMFPVRWVADLGYGYGYPIFNFYAPLAYYIGAVFMLIGFNALIATKLMIGLGVVLSGVFMYLLAKEFWGRAGGILSAVLYVYAPYHALNIFVRGAIAELWAYAFVPLAFLGIYKTYRHCEEAANLRTTKQSEKDRRATLAMTRSLWLYICLTAVSYAAIIISHNLTAMMVTPFLFAFALFLYLKNRLGTKTYKPHFVLLGLLMGIILSAFYWLPVIFEMKYTDVLSVVGGGSDYRDHFACLSQLWNSPWAFGGSVPGCMDGLSFKIGKLHILLSLFALFPILYLSKKDKTKFQLCVMFVVFAAGSIFLTLKESKFIWDTVVHMSFFQFPWRFIALAVFFLSFLAGAVSIVVDLIKLPKSLLAKGSYLSVAVLTALVIYINGDVFTPQNYINSSSTDYTNKENINWKTSKISDEYMPPRFFKPLRAVDVPKEKFESREKIKILSYKEKTQEINAKIETAQNAKIFVNLAYFPGWHVFIDKQQVWFKYSGQGLIIDVPKGVHEVDIKFTQTPIEKTGNAISVAGVILLLTGIIGHRKKLTNGK